VPRGRQVEWAQAIHCYERETDQMCQILSFDEKPIIWVCPSQATGRFAIGCCQPSA
jgi:hypothetical protein